MLTKMSPEAEIKGILVLGALNTARKEGITHLLDEVSRYKPDGWYSVAGVREMLEEIVAQRNVLDSSYDLVSLGVAVSLNVPLPPDWTSFETFLANYRAYHQQFYRNTGVDWMIKGEAAGECCFKVHFRINFPDLFMYGWVQGFALRFLPEGTPFMVLFDDKVTRADFGGEETVVWVKWGSLAE